MIPWQKWLIYISIAGGLSVWAWLPLTTVSVGPTAFLDDTERLYFQRLVGQSALWTRISTRAFDRWKNPHPSVHLIAYTFPTWRTCTITLQEKSPDFLFIQDDRTTAMHRDGSILNPRLPAPHQLNNPDMMIIRGMPVAPHQLNALAIIKHRLSGYPNLGSLHIEASFQNDYIIYLNDALPIKLGPLTHLDKKLDALESFLKHNSATHTMHYIDLRYTDRVIVNYTHGRS
ncbi:MAG: hypothetical protein P8L47_01465 [Candidatus Marinamargulisbacteria bacterium]|jgi:hypothetical protein|nr:hypothetical protein [bacterium]MDG2264771.1 hypothetical protein [Candidatus Marinamargulisbacteria bacterium]|tara:strand:+ start:399 stop:1088 length:690 start_codon:yes stop_codon:yes gene_type:complete